MLLMSLVLWAVIFGRGPEYVPLFTQLDPRDAGDIVRLLDDKKVPYRLAEGGTAIMVPASTVHGTRLAVASQGLPRGGVVGFEIIDRTQIGTTDFERRINYLRALQGELTRTIMQVEGVEQARVHIVLPEPSVFVSRARPATAAVFLKLKPYQTLDRSQVKGIVNLVARSVEGLKPEEVTVVDVYGRILSGDTEEAASAEGSAPSATSLLEIQKGFQKDLERSLQSLLEQVLGPGNVVTRVTAELNFDQKTVEKQLFQPVVDQSGILRSMQELQESFSGTGSAAGGVPGVDSNITYQAEAAGSQTTSEKKEITKNFELNEIKERLVVAPGTVRRLSVAVVVNRELSATEQKAIENTVTSAIGMDTQRRDQITVTGLPFNTSMAEEMKVQLEAERKAAASMRRWYVIGTALGLGVLGVLGLQWSRRRRALREAMMAIQQGKVAVRQVASAEVTPEEEEKRRIREQIEKLAQQKPESVAQLLRTWLTEE